MDLTSSATDDLERLLRAIETQRLRFPLTGLSLRSEGTTVSPGIVEGLNAIGREGAIACVSAALAERRHHWGAAELVWTGPESRASAARDTAVVLANLFQTATTNVLVAGFVFDHASDVLRPLHEAMRRGVSCRIFADGQVASSFIRDHWPFGPPLPDLYGFAPGAGVAASLHAKCVVVDGRSVFVTSANFTDRGQTRNIEVGVLLDDPQLAEILEAQFGAGGWFCRV